MERYLKSLKDGQKNIQTYIEDYELGVKIGINKFFATLIENKPRWNDKRFLLEDDLIWCQDEGVVSKTLPNVIARRVSKIWDGKLYMPEDGGASLEIFNIKTGTSKSVVLSTNNTRRSIQVWDDNLYLIGNSNILEIFNVKTESVRTLTLSTSMVRETSQIWNSKLYMPESGGTTLEIFDLLTETTTTKVLHSNAGCGTSQIWDNKLYLPSMSGMNMEIFNLNTGTSYVISLPTAMGRITSQIWNDKLYMPEDCGTTLEIFNMMNETTRVVVLPKDVCHSSSHIFEGKLYMVESNGNFVDIFDLEKETSESIALTGVNNKTSQIYAGKLYIPGNNVSKIEIYSFAKCFITQDTDTVKLSGSGTPDDPLQAYFIGEFADAFHNHDTIYSAIGHEHGNNLKTVAVKNSDTVSLDGDGTTGNPLVAEVIADFADADHNHEGVYSEEGHTHNDLYSEIEHNHDNEYSAFDHEHEEYLKAVETINTEFIDFSGTGTSDDPLKVEFIGGFADLYHKHDDLYAKKIHDHEPETETMINNALASYKVKDAKFDDDTNVLTISYSNNSTANILIPTLDLIKDIKYDSTTEELVLVKNDDSELRVGVSALIDIYTGGSTTNIQVSVNPATNVITANLISNSITETHLVDALKDKINAKMNKVFTDDGLTVEFSGDGTLDDPLTAEIIGNFADAFHNHTGVYSPVSHDHTGVYAPNGHAHTGVYAPIIHDHEGDYLEAVETTNSTSITLSGDGTLDSPLKAEIIGSFADAVHNHNTLYSPIGHAHTGVYAPIIHDHEGDYLEAVETTNSTSITLSGDGTGDDPLKAEFIGQYVKSVDFNETNYIVTFNFRTGAPLAVSLPIIDLLKDIDFDESTAEIILIRKDDSEIRVDVSYLIDVYTGSEGDNIEIEVSDGNVISAVLLDDSVTEAQLATVLVNKINAKLNSVVTQNTSTVSFTGSGTSGSPLKADVIGDFADAFHNHDGIYSELGHNHTGVYSPISHDHTGVYSGVGHAHTGVYAPIIHDHEGDYLEAVETTNSTSITLSGDGTLDSPLKAEIIGSFADALHNHDGAYSPSGHNHDTAVAAAIATAIANFNVNDVRYNSSTRVLTITYKNNTTETITIPAPYTGIAGTNIQVSVNSGTNEISASIVNGSIIEAQLDSALTTKINSVTSKLASVATLDSNTIVFTGNGTSATPLKAEFPIYKQEIVNDDLELTKAAAKLYSKNNKGFVYISLPEN